MHLTRSLLLAACCLLLAVPFTSVTAQEDVFFPTTEWRVSSPEAQGMDSAELANFFVTFSQDEFNLDSLLVLRNGVIVAEAYAPPFEQTMKHEMWSASKSVMSALIGILLRDGLLESVDTPVLSLFPNMTFQNVDANKEAMTVRHLLTMTSGLSCDMYFPGGDPGDAMFTSENWLQFALDLPMGSTPGTEFHYCNANTYILSAIVTELTGRSAGDFAAEQLFAPLGITDSFWETSPQGIAVGAAGLHLTTRDMAKIGYLYLNGGLWDGVQIIPADYVAASLTAQVDPGWPDTAYSYQWWNMISPGTYAALGRGGQYIVLVPAKDLVIVATGTIPESLRAYIHGYPLNYAASGLTAAEGALPENAAALSQLENQIAQITTPATVAAVPLPAIAAQINGQTFGLLTPLTLPAAGVMNAHQAAATPAALRFDFLDETQANLTFISSTGETWTLPIGLNGRDLVMEDSPVGPLGSQGMWHTDTEFSIWMDYIGDGQAVRWDITFLPGGIETFSTNLVADSVGVSAGVLMQ